MKSKTIVSLILVIILIIIAGAIMVFTSDEYRVEGVTSFEECVQRGNPIMESYPRQCRAGDKTFVENVSQSPAANIIVTSPAPNEQIGTTLVVRGQARVYEGTVLYTLKDSAGKVLKTGFTTAAAEETGTFGPFEISTTYTKSSTAAGSLEVYSESAENGQVQDLVTIPVTFPSNR